MNAALNAVLDAFWRAAAYCLLPRVILLSVLPLLLACGLGLGLGYFYWESAVAAVRDTLQTWSLIAAFFHWLESLGAADFRSVLAPLIIVALAIPVTLALSLLLVALLMTPALVTLVARRRFPTLERRRGAPFWQSVLWSLGCTLLALFALILSMPLWLLPPLVLLLPPLIWGWLTCKVMSFDALAEHASADERQTLMREQRWPLLAVGMITGYLGAAPSLLWALSAATLIFAPLLIVVSIWLYTLIFAFASLWFTHFALAALDRLRSEREGQILPATAPAPVAAPLAPPSLPSSFPPSV